MSTLYIGWTTVSTPDDAHALARKLLEAKLAACVHIDAPHTAVYTWEGKLCTEAETRLWVKFASHKADAMKALLTQAHPYDTPQWIVCEATDALPAYAKWVNEA